MRAALRFSILAAAGAAIGAVAPVTVGAQSDSRLFPPGPPEPTMKRLDEIDPRRCIPTLPYTIAESGAYQLCSDLVGVPGEHGIIIAAPDVSIDFSGFRLMGDPGGASGDGIRFEEGGQNVFVHNLGTVAGWGGAGFRATSAGLGAATEQVSFTFAKMEWSRNAGGGVIIEDMVSSGEPGIAAFKYKMMDCFVNSNTGAGVKVGIVDGTSNTMLISETTIDGNEIGILVTGSTAADTVPTEEMSLNFEEIKVTYNRAGGVVLEDILVTKEVDKSSVSLRMADSLVANNGGDGVRISGVGGMTVEMDVIECRFHGNDGNGFAGIWADADMASLQIRSSRIASNGKNGAIIAYDMMGDEISIKLVSSDFNGNEEAGVLFIADGAPLRSAVKLDRVDTSSNGGHGAHFAPALGKFSLSFDTWSASQNGGNGFLVQESGLEGPRRPNPYFIKFEGVEGEAQSNDGHGGEIDIESWSWGMTNMGGYNANGNGGSGLRIIGGESVDGSVRIRGGSFSRNAEAGLSLVGQRRHEIHDIAATNNGGDGVYIEGEDYLVITLTDSLIASNTGHGINGAAEAPVRGSGIISGNVATSNGGPAIMLACCKGTHLTGNVISGHRNSETNENAGIVLMQGGNRVENNTFVDNDRGVVLFANGNPVYGNTFHGNTEPVFQDSGSGVERNVAPFSSIMEASNPFNNILH